MESMLTTAADLEFVLDRLRAHAGDAAFIEVKSAQGGFPQNLGTTLCAFANMPEGGWILLGVREPDFAVLGVDSPADYEARIINVAQTAIKPTPTVTTSTIVTDGRAVVVAFVHPLAVTFKPALFQGNPYLRQADGDYLMPANEQRMLEVAKLTAQEEPPYELRQVPDTGVDDLDSVPTAQYIDEMRRVVRPLKDASDEQVLKATRVLRSGDLTVAGLYGLGSFPQGAFPSLSVTVAVRHHDDSSRNGSSQMRTSNLETFYGSVIELFNQTMQWVRSNITYYQQYQDSGDLRSVPEFPLSAIREAVANALIHRDLGPNTVEAGKAIDIRITPDKLIVSSPGGLKAVTASQLYSEELTRVEVNQRLYRIAKTLTDGDGNRLIEGEGGGVQLMIREMERAGLPRPIIVDTGVKVTVIFARVKPEDRGVYFSSPENRPPRIEALQVDRRSDTSKTTLAGITRNGPVIVDAIRKQGGSSTLAEISEITGLNTQQVRYGLNALGNSHVVRRDGGPGIRTTTYRLV